jgi:hypothetical protein
VHFAAHFEFAVFLPIPEERMKVNTCAREEV